MAKKRRWVAVDLSGNEFMYLKYPPRRSESAYGQWKIGADGWKTVTAGVVKNGRGTYVRKDEGELKLLSKGSIFRLIGRALTWKDEPVELKI